jgi:hypothetical protein
LSKRDDDGVQEARAFLSLELDGWYRDSLRRLGVLQPRTTWKKRGPFDDVVDPSRRFVDHRRIASIGGVRFRVVNRRAPSLDAGDRLCRRGLPPAEPRGATPE